jgi:alpha-1,6-mannosyltransferase
MSRVLQAANFVAPHSGGIRTVLDHLASGYAAAGHEVIQVVPGRSTRATAMPWGQRITLRAAPLPGTGYRVMRYRTVERVVATLQPERIEVHDRSTLRGLGAWARENRVPSLVVSHERLDRLVAQWLPDVEAVRRLVDHNNSALWCAFDNVVCTTAWAAEEFQRIATPNLIQVPLGVDVNLFSPGVDAQLRRQLAPDDATLLIMTSRMSREKRPELAIGTVEELVKRGENVVMVVAGDGPMRSRMERMSRRLPVTFVGHVDRARLAALLGAADVAIAPGPVETFGLAALEALASGTPVVANGCSALREVLGTTAGIAADPSPAAFADAVQQLAQRPESMRRTAARVRAEHYDWATTVAGFLRVHGLPHDVVRAA